MELRAMPWHESIIESELSKTRVLINATSIGLVADETPLPAEILPPDLLVLDLIYNRTRFLRDAEAAGCRAIDGERMLLAQGGAAFTLWTGQPAPVDAMRDAFAAARASGVRSAEGEATGAPGDEIDVPGDATAGSDAAAGGPAGAEAPAGTEAPAPSAAE
jgi:hypothetical protein